MPWQLSYGQKQNFPSKRPNATDRKFVSTAVEHKIKELKEAIADPELAWMFENCFPNTLDTTVTYKEENGRPDTFVITGDIPAMWLRDSTAQVWPYLSLIKGDEKLQKLIAGVVHRQTKCILIDPYANAFNDGPGESMWHGDLTDMKPELHERKWEIDSLCYAIRLAHGYWKESGDASIFTPEWKKASQLIVKTFKEQQRKEGNGPYSFMRVTGWQPDTQAGRGYGNPVKPVGLIFSAFRPSDDATIFPFLVPSNLFAVVSLKQLASIYKMVEKDEALAKECELLAQEVAKALSTYAVVDHKNYGEIYPYEVDGFGSVHFMDDANIPSLLSLPYLGAVTWDDPIYQNTRKFIWSKDNPYFFEGKYGHGIGGPHVGMDYIWPMSIIMFGITSQSEEEISWAIDTLKKTHANTGFMHETFHKNDPNDFTRKWFAWANTLFGEFILKTYNERPHLLS